MPIGILRVAEPHNQHGDSHARQQGGRELDAVMPVELKLGKEVGAGDAQERARAKRECPAQPGRMVWCQVARPEEEEQGANGRYERESEVDPPLRGKPRN